MKISKVVLQLAVFALFTGIASADTVTFYLPDALTSFKPGSCCAGPRWNGLRWLGPTPTASPLPGSEPFGWLFGDPLDPFHWIGMFDLLNTVDPARYGAHILLELPLTSTETDVPCGSGPVDCTPMQEGVPVVEHIAWSDGTVDSFVFIWQSVPEPGSVGLLLGAAAVTAVANYRRRRI